MQPIESQPDPTRPTRWPASLGWGTAVLVVVAVWAVAIVMRHGGGTTELTGWVDGLEAGQALAVEQDRPMVVLFTASWCGPCQTLKKDVLSQPDVADALEAGFVAVTVDMTHASAGDPLARQYGITGYPTVIAMTPEGKAIEHFEGERSVTGFTAWLKRIE